MNKNRFAAVLISLSICLFMFGTKALAAQPCADQYSIKKTLANGATWDMCWSHSKNQGISYHHIFYTPKDGNNRRMVLFDASIAQIHVPYDDGRARFHDVSTFGLGDDGVDDNLVALSPAECKNGALSYLNSKAVVCSQVISNHEAFRMGSASQKSQKLNVFSASQVGQYIYAIKWAFHDDGRITPSIDATGALQRFAELSGQEHGWLVNAGNQIGLSHMHNFYWRLDFDIDGTGNNDIVEELNYDVWQGKRYKKLTRFITEAARSVDPQRMRSWIVKDGNTTNNKGHAISYEIRLNESGQREIGPAFEAFTNNDFYVTRTNECELLASQNAAVNNCNANDLNQFVSGESIVNQDIVAWVGVSFYHVPRAEDWPKMDAHVSGFQLIPRDWHTTNPTLDMAPPVSLRISAKDDFVTSPSAPITIDVMANDTGQAIEINTLDDPANGTAVVVDNRVRYTPDSGFLGTDVFWYTIKDDAGDTYGTKIHVNVIRPTNNSVSRGGGAVFLIEILSLLMLGLLRFWAFRNKQDSQAL